MNVMGFDTTWTWRACWTRCICVCICIALLCIESGMLNKYCLVDASLSGWKAHFIGMCTFNQFLYKCFRGKRADRWRKAT